MVFNFNPLKRIKMSSDIVNQCNCKYDSPRKVYFERQVRARSNNTSRLSSVCSEAATERGKGQKVLSFSMFGQNKSHYINGLIKNIQAAKKYYGSEYLVRLYFEPKRIEKKHFKDKLCDLLCTEPSLDLCDVNNIGKVFQNFT